MDGRVRDPRWDWASHDQYIHSVFDDLLKPRRWPFDVAVAPLFHGTAAGHSAIEAALSKPASEVAWYIYCSITHAYSDGLSGQALFADLLRFYHEERETQGGPSSAAKEELGPTPEPLALLQRRLWRSLCKPGNLPEPNDDLYHESICDDWGRRAGQSRRIYFHPNVTRTLRLAARHCFGCSVDLAWLTAIMCTMFRLFPQQPRMLLILKASCRDGPGQGQMVGFLSEARLIAVDAGDLATANIWEVHKLIDSARLARDWRAPEPFEFGLCVPGQSIWHWTVLELSHSSPPETAAPVWEGAAVRTCSIFRACGRSYRSPPTTWNALLGGMRAWVPQSPRWCDP